MLRNAQKDISQGGTSGNLVHYDQRATADLVSGLSGSCCILYFLHTRFVFERGVCRRIMLRDDMRWQVLPTEESPSRLSSEQSWQRTCTSFDLPVLLAFFAE